jgi:hypothetical protein
VDPVQIALYTAALPAVTAGAVLLLAHRARRGGGVAADAGPAIAAGFLAGFLGVAGPPKFPILDDWKWLFWIALAGGVLAVLASRATDPPVVVKWILRTALAAFAVGVTILDRTVLWIAGPVAVALAMMASASAVSERVGPPAFLGALAAVATGTAVTAGASNSAMLGQMGGVLTSATAACFVLSWFFPVAVRGTIALSAAVTVTVGLNGLLYAAFPAVSAALLAAAMPAALAAARLTANATPGRRAWAVVGAAAACSAAAAAIAIHLSEPFPY